MVYQKNDDPFMDKTPIKNTIDSYFKSRFEYQNGLSTKNYTLDLLEKNSSFYKNVEMEDDYNREINLLSEEKIRKIIYNNIISKIDKKNGEWIAFVEFKVNFNYDNSENLDSIIEEKHILHLKKTNGEYYISADIFDEERDLKQVNDEYEKSKVLYEKNVNENNEVKKIAIENFINNEREKKYENYNMIQIRSYNTYNRNGARNWALDYCHKIPWDYDADCTNFVSKAMCYGGHMKTDNVWYYHSNAWIRVIELRDWLINNNYAEEMDNYKYAMVGDIIQYLNKSNVWRHSVIVTTRTNSYSYVKVTAHSRNRRNVNVSGIYYPKGEFKSYRVLHITR